MFLPKAIEIKLISIYNLLGQLVIAVPNTKDTSSIDISRLNSGTYVLSVKSDGGEFQYEAD
ncbi:T9SS type A sorting domain-containing protein [Flavobacterium hydrophilum]|uniref:T9SS type A sorting domain-containing protein n=1 Tax=Flavobacterium hydrophilum TaxID=2211445 RepID=UPI0029373893|nr:T9SS type A sorting domain-containing protein [Flavobacterium hydrophilum]